MRIRVFYLAIILLACSSPLLANISFASNASYIALSNQIARKTHLQVATNNMANSNSIGYQADNMLFCNIDVKQTPKRSNSFVSPCGIYRNEKGGTLKITNRPLDLAVTGQGYFKVLTPAGERYTHNGAILISSDYQLVNHQGMPFASAENEPIVLPADSRDVYITEDGGVYADGEQVDFIGVFGPTNPKNLKKEGNDLYSSQDNDILLEQFTIVSGALMSSNVSSVAVMTDIMELEKSASMTNNFQADIHDLERSTFSKLGSKN